VLDGTRFQPWVFHYPSGLRLQVVADTLADLLEELRSTHRIPAVIVVAHSAGGLVARMAVRQRDRGPPSAVKLLVTLSTPWQGHAGASKGLGRSPVVVPAWIDMAQGSAFLEALGASRLPAGLAYHLFFGYRGGETLTMRENTDGSVTLQSMLDRRAQAEAVRVHGFHEDHTSILRSAEVSRALSQLLDETAAGARVPAGPATAAKR
jgi:pimeloyl-ACP methyl ester carboxylesterase